jgi:hypothetical protein
LTQNRPSEQVDVRVRNGTGGAIAHAATVPRR